MSPYRCLRCGESRLKKSPCPPPTLKKWSYRYNREANEKGELFLPPRPELFPATRVPEPDEEADDEALIENAVRELEDAGQ